MQLVQTVSVFKLTDANLRQRAPTLANSSEAVTTVAKHAKAQRRGPDRASKVTRPAFGKVKSTVVKKKPQASVESMAARTGTDDWESF